MNRKCLKLKKNHYYNNKIMDMETNKFIQSKSIMEADLVKETEVVWQCVYA